MTDQPMTESGGQYYRNIHAVLPAAQKVLNWSYWQASRIVHYNTVTGKDISITVNQANWSWDLERPYVTFSVSIQNRVLFVVIWLFNATRFPKKTGRIRKSRYYSIQNLIGLRSGPVKSGRFEILYKYFYPTK
jgi:hypothetical protein